MARARHDFQAAAQRSGACLHILESMTVSASLAGVESDSIILHYEANPPVVQVKCEADCVSVSVTETISHGFSRNGEKLRRLLRSQPVCGLTAHVQSKVKLRGMVQVAD